MEVAVQTQDVGVSATTATLRVGGDGMATGGTDE